IVRLGHGDIEGYRQTCAEALKRFGRANDVYAAHWLARACIVGSRPIVDPKQLIHLCEASDPAYARPTRHPTLDGGLYRIGQFDKVIAEFKKNPKWRDNTVAERNELFLAMAYYRAGHIDESTQWLQMVMRWREAYREKWQKEWTWYDRLE